jgi:hypothetical protein
MSTSDHDLGFDRIVAQLKTLNRYEVVVGVQGSEDSEHVRIASLQEFGSHEWTVTKKQAYYMTRFLMKIDPIADKARFWGTWRKLVGKKMKIERSFLRATFDREQPLFDKATTRVHDAILKGDTEALAALAQFGLFAEVVFRRGFDHVSPANAPLTIAVKGSSKPLIASGRLRNSITAVVRTRGTGEGEGHAV